MFSSWCIVIICAYTSQVMTFNEVEFQTNNWCARTYLKMKSTFETSNIHQFSRSDEVPWKYGQRIDRINRINRLDRNHNCVWLPCDCVTAHDRNNWNERNGRINRNDLSFLSFFRFYPFYRLRMLWHICVRKSWFVDFNGFLI